MAADPAPPRTPLGMRLLWLLLPAVLFGLYFWSLLRSGDPGAEPAAPPAVEDEAPADGR